MHLVRRILPLLALAAVLAAVAVVDARPAQAQTQLVLSDFDQTGLEVELLALITAGNTTVWWARGRFGERGTLVDGEHGIGPDNNKLIRLREGSQGGDLLINHDSNSVLNFSSYFGAGGGGEDLTLHIQLSATEVYSVPVAGNLITVGGGYATIDLTDTGGQQEINDVAVGDRVIIAFTRPGNAAPVFADDSYSRRVSETALTGANVGTPITADDADDATLAYALSGTGAADFSVSATGQITVASALDYETTSSYSLTLTATDSAGAADTATVTIKVRDVNEAPSFASGSATRSVPENSVANTNVGSAVTATDPEGDTLQYTLLNGGGRFTIVSATGRIRVASGADLDYETTQSYQVTVRATDGGGLYGAVSVTINVRDVNEAPSFASGSATRSVPENSVANTNVGSAVTATDPEGDTLRYTLLNGGGRFTVVSATGRIRVASGADLDYETTQSYQVTVRATDGGGLYGEVSVTINVEAVNEAPSFASGSATRSVPENSVANTNVGSAVTATDPEGDTLRYTLLNSGGRFTVGSATGRIQVASGADLDYESTQSYQVTVRATDNTGLYGEVSVTIVVTDEVEAPRFAAPSYTRRIAEDAGPGANIGAAIVATDADGLTLTYSLSGAGAANFNVSASGQVTVSTSASLDHETASSYSLTIQAEASSGTATAALIITVTDVDEPPVFAGATAARTIAETAAAGERVGAPVTATDPERGSITYSLSGADAASFEAGGSTGQITLGRGVSLDPATKPSYSVTVTATDSGNNAGSIAVAINVKDVRDAVAAAEASVGPAYLGTIHLVVGNGGNWYGYEANGYGGLTTGRLPSLLFVDHVDRPLELAAVNSGTNQLRLRYSDTETGLLKASQALQWLRVQVRAADNTVLAGGNLWDAAGCVDRTLCLNVGANIDFQNANAVAVDFFDAAAEALEASSGGVMSILLMAEETGPDATGFDDSAGDHIAGYILGEWMVDGEERDIEQLFVKHGTSGRVVEIHYSNASPTGQWRSDPDEYKRWRLTFRDRAGEMLLQVRLRDALAAMTETERRCGDASAQRRLCVRYDDDDFDGANHRGQVMLVQIEDVRGIALIEEAPGGAVGGQIMLTIFGGLMAGWRARRLRTPVREAVILVFMAFGAMILPFLGIGNLFWAGGILVLAAVAAAAVFFMSAK